MRAAAQDRLRRVKGVLWFITGVAAAVTVARFLGGLGAVTNLTDKTPWGLWIGFDVLGGVALAAGGFVIAGFVYILRREELRPLLRPAILTAFLGYVAVAVGLMYDIGRPWNIWRPMFFWQHHSALFEVAWCVMLYLTVLALEFAPVPLSASRFHGISKLLKKVTLPLVVLGIMLSTLHQSSLGTLFVIAPGRVHPLWYSPLLPLIFLLSAVALGLAMVSLESKLTSWLYGRKPEDGLVTKLQRPLAIVLLLYMGLRLVDLVARGHADLLFSGTWETALFWFEIGLSAILPTALILTGVARRSGAWIGATAAFVVAGFVLHRIDVGGVSGVGITGAGYFPSVGEIVTSLGIVSGAVLVFLFFVENFHVYEPEEAEEVADPRPVWRRYRAPLATARSSSLLFVAGVAVAFAFIPTANVFGARPLRTPVREARRVMAVGSVVVKPGEELPEAAREVLSIDGNRDGRYVVFDHDAHVERQGGRKSCTNCHHLNRPNDRETSCYECHRDQYEPTDIFRHGVHVDATGGNPACVQCHTDRDAPKTRASTTACRECHREFPAELSDFVADGYVDAMHGTCLECHKEEDAKAGARVPKLALCGNCHVEPVDLTPVPNDPKPREDEQP